jgi:hypothetical protein
MGIDAELGVFEPLRGGMLGKGIPGGLVELGHECPFLSFMIKLIADH